MKNTKVTEFLESLNLIAKQEERPAFGVHSPNDNEALAYAYTYVSTEQLAREVAAWLLQKDLDSEIFYVENKKQFIVKIPFVNTYYKDYFEKKECPDELIAIKTVLGEAVKQVRLEWVGKCSQLSKVVELYYARFLENRKIRKADLVQTTLFQFGVNYASSSVIDQAVDQTINLRGLLAQVENFINNIKVFDREIISINRSLAEKAKNQRVAPDQARLDIARVWITYRNTFFDVCTTNLCAATELRQLDNFLYQQWLFINKQLQLIKSDDKKAHFLDRWQDLKVRCMSAANYSRQKLQETPESLYMDGIDHYMRNFLTYESGFLKGSDKKIAHEEKLKADAVIQRNQTTIREIREKYEALRAEVTALAREMFMPSNAGPVTKIEPNKNDPLFELK